MPQPLAEYTGAAIAVVAQRGLLRSIRSGGAGNRSAQDETMNSQRRPWLTGAACWIFVQSGALGGCLAPLLCASAATALELAANRKGENLQQLVDEAPATPPLEIDLP